MIIAKNRDHLISIIQKEIIEKGDKCDLNHINTSMVTNMSNIFYCSRFNGNISRWDVSNVKDMSYMFCFSKFNGDISNWDVSNIINMNYMFYCSSFEGELDNWDISSVNNMYATFLNYSYKKPTWYIEDEDDRNFFVEKLKLRKKLKEKLIHKNIKNKLEKI